MANRAMLDRFGTEQGWRFVEEVSFQPPASPPFQLIPFQTTPQDVEVIFDISKLPLPPPAVYARYLVLRRLLVRSQRPKALADRQKVGQFQANTLVIPPNATTTLTTWFQHNAITAVGFGNLPAGITFVAASVTPHNVAPSLGSAVQTATPLFFDLTHLYGTQGYTNPLPLNNDWNFGPTPAPDWGIDFAIQFTSTNATPTNYVQSIWGYDEVEDFAYFTLDYVDWTNTTHHLGTYDDTLGGTLFELDEIIPTPITDVGMTDFGKLRFTMVESFNYFLGSGQFGFTQQGWNTSILLTAALAYTADD